MALKSRGNIANSTTAITSHVGHFSNVVEHVATGEQQDRDKADGSPKVAVLDNWQHVRRRGHQSCANSQDNDSRSDPSHPVDGPLDRWVRSIRHMASDPSMNLLSGSWSVSHVLSTSPCSGWRTMTYPLLKSYLMGSCLATA